MSSYVMTPKDQPTQCGHCGLPQADWETLKWHFIRRHIFNACEECGDKLTKANFHEVNGRWLCGACWVFQPVSPDEP